jgi:hypothetical protein
MDFILEHNDDPIPVISGTNETSTSTPQTGLIGEDDDEDAALLGLQSGAAGAAEVEARVSRTCSMEVGDFINI